MRSASVWRAFLAVLLVFALVTTGCGATQRRPLEDGSGRIVHGASGDGVHKTYGGDARAGFIILGCVLIVFAFVVDVIILPCTIPNDRPFCCTEGIVVYCFH